MSVRDANRYGEKWQQYKAWLIAQTADTDYPADEQRLQQMYEGGLFPWDDSTRCEARSWLRNPVVPALLAANRFETLAAGVAFVEHLYALGAEAVMVTNIDHRKINFDLIGPHSDTLIVALPQDVRQRRAILDVAQAEQCDTPGQPIADTGKGEIVFWWD